MLSSKAWAAAVLSTAAAAGLFVLLTRPGAPPDSSSGMAPGMAPGMASGMEMSSDGVAQLAAPRQDQSLPAFEFVDLSGQKHSSESLRGSVVVMDVWASWCGPCKEEMPAFEQLHKKYAAQGLRILGVSIDITADDARQFARSVGVTYPIIHRPAIMSEWGLLGLPTTFIVDRAGVIRRMVIGFEYPDSFEKSVRELLQQPG